MVENMVVLSQGINNSLYDTITPIKVDLTTHYAIAAHLLEIKDITENSLTPTLYGPTKGRDISQEFMLLLCNPQQIEWKTLDTGKPDDIDANYLEEFSQHLILNYFSKHVINSTGQDIFENPTLFPIHSFNKTKYFVFFKFLQIPLEKFKSDSADIKLTKFFERLQKKQEMLAKVVIPAILDQLPNPLFDEFGIQTVTTLAREATKTISETHVDSMIFEKIRAATPFYNNPTKVLMLFNLIQDSSIKLAVFQLNFTRLERDASLRHDLGTKKFFRDQFEPTFREFLSKGNIPNHLYVDIYRIYWEKVYIYKYFHQEILKTFLSKGLPPNTSLGPELNQHILKLILSHNYPTHIKLNYIQLCIQYKNNIANPDERDQFFLDELKAFITNQKNATKEKFGDKIKIAQTLYATLDGNEFKIKALQFIFQELTLYLQLINLPQDTITTSLKESQSLENHTSLLSTTFATLLESTQKNIIPNEILNSFYQSYWTTLSQASKQLHLLYKYLSFLPGFFAHGLPANIPISCFDNQTILQRCTADDIDPEISDKLFQFIIKGCQRNKKNISNVMERDQFFFEVLKLGLRKFKYIENSNNFFLSLASTIKTPTLRIQLWDLLLLEKLPAIFYIALITNYNKLDKVAEIRPISYSGSDNSFVAVCHSKSHHEIDGLIFKLLHTATQPLDNIFIEYLGNLEIEGSIAKKLVLTYIEALSISQKRTAYALATGDEQSNLYRFFHTPRGLLKRKDNDLIEAMEANLEKIRNDEQLPNDATFSVQKTFSQLTVSVAATSQPAATSSNFLASFFSTVKHDTPTEEYHDDQCIELIMLKASDSEDETPSQPSSPRFT